MRIVVFNNNIVLGVLRCDWNKLSAEGSEGFKILDFIFISLSESDANDACTDRIFREDVLCLSFFSLPYTLCSYLILSCLNADEKLIIRNTVENKFILRKKCIYFPKDCNFKAVGISLFINKVIRSVE